MPLFKKLEIPATPQRIFKAKPKGERSPSIRKELGLTPSLIKKTVEQLYAERGILVVHFSYTNIPDFSLSEDGRFGVLLSKSSKRFTLYFFKVDLRKQLRENPGVYTQTSSLIELTDLIEDFCWSDKITADLACRNMRDKIMLLMAGEIEERIRKQRQRFGFLPPEDFINSVIEVKKENVFVNSIITDAVTEERQVSLSQNETNKNEKLLPEFKEKEQNEKEVSKVNEEDELEEITKVEPPKRGFLNWGKK